MRVKLTKLAELEEATFKSGDLNSYKIGQMNYGVSLPLDYYLEGDMSSNPKVGEPVVVFRESRNGIKSLGLFKSSPVTEISNQFFKTDNSVYLLEKL